jgi:hypothetical protein
MTQRMGILPRLTFALWWDVPRATLPVRLGVPPHDAWHGLVSHPITGHFPPLLASRAAPTGRADAALPTPRPNIAMPRRTRRRRMDVDDDTRRRERHRAPPPRRQWGDRS